MLSPTALIPWDEEAIKDAIKDAKGSNPDKLADYLKKLIKALKKMYQDIVNETNIQKDHGALGGLADDDHTRYLDKDGTRALTGDWALGTHKITELVDPTVAQGAATKLYVDTRTPTGSIIAWPTETPPTGWLECDGSSLLRTTYADLFTVIGVMYGNVDADHFNLPDLRGRFPRGWDHGAGVDPDAATRTDRGDTTTGDHVGTKQADEFESHLHKIKSTEDLLIPPGGITYARHGGATDYDGEATGGNETRPININVMWCIKY